MLVSGPVRESGDCTDAASAGPDYSKAAGGRSCFGSGSDG